MPSIFQGKSYQGYLLIKLCLAFVFSLFLFLPLSMASDVKSNAAQEEQIYNLSQEIFDEINKKYLIEFQEVFKNFPRSFFPYRLIYPYKRDLHTNLTENWCKENMRELCVSFKRSYRKIFHEILAAEKDKNYYLEPGVKNINIIEKLNQKVRKLRKIYFQDKEIADKYLRSLLILENNRLELEFELLNKNLFPHYTEYYDRAAAKYPFKILHSQTFMSLITGNKFEIKAIDLYIAVKELMDNIRNRYILELYEKSKKSIRSDDKEIDKIYIPNKIFELNKKIISSKKNIKQATWKEYPQISFTKFNDDEHYHLFERFHGNSANVARLLNHEYYQKAIWALREENKHEKANALESYILTKVMATESVEHLKPLGGGISNSLKAFFPMSVVGVYKQKEVFKMSMHASDLFAHLLSGYKKEIAAFHLDKILNLNMVPMTKETILGLGRKIGSLQFFVRNSYNARELSRVDINLPIKKSKSGRADERISLPKDAKFFDWLIENGDRHLDNYLLQYDGTVVLIDHGFTFVSPVFFKPSKKTLKNLVPSIKLQEKIIELNSKKQLVESTLTGLLDQKQINIIIRKISYMAKYLNSHPKANPSHKK